LGIVAPEFPPSIGGMQAVASGFARHLTKYCDVVVITKEQQHDYSEPFPVFSDLTGRMDLDLASIKKHQADVLLFMNAGYAPLATELTCPSFVYAHGYDFLKPWALRKTYANVLPRLSRLPVVGKAVAAYRHLKASQDLQ